MAARCAVRVAARRHVAAGSLKILMLEWSGTKLPVCVAFPSSRHVPAKVRAFVEFAEALVLNQPAAEWSAWNQVTSPSAERRPGGPIQHSNQRPMADLFRGAERCSRSVRAEIADQIGSRGMWAARQGGTEARGADAEQASTCTPCSGSSLVITRRFVGA